MYHISAIKCMTFVTKSASGTNGGIVDVPCKKCHQCSVVCVRGTSVFLKLYIILLLYLGSQVEISLIDHWLRCHCTSVLSLCGGL